MEGAVTCQALATIPKALMPIFIIRGQSLGFVFAFPVAMCGCERWTIKKAEELMLSNCGAEEDSWESLGLQEEG